MINKEEQFQYVRTTLVWDAYPTLLTNHPNSGDPFLPEKLIGWSPLSLKKRTNGSALYKDKHQRQHVDFCTPINFSLPLITIHDSHSFELWPSGSLRCDPWHSVLTLHSIHLPSLLPLRSLPLDRYWHHMSSPSNPESCFAR